MSDYEVPRGDLFADPSASLVWAAICTLEESAQHEILRELRARLAVAEDRDTPQAIRVARAISALREAADLLEAGERLSIDAYKRMRVEHPNHGWPPESSVRRWLGGSWNDALRRAGLEAIPDGDVITYRLGSAFTRDEAIAAVRQCAEELEAVPSLSRYVFWAKRPEVRRRPGRRPASQGAFDRLFGGWLNALRAADLIDSDAPALAPRLSAGQIRPTGYRFTLEQIHQALREVSERVGGSPRSTEYQRQRAQMLDEQAAAGGPVRAIPSFNVINDRYATWDDALIDAGLEPLGGRGTGQQPKHRRSSKRVSDEQILAALREAYERVGDPFTTTAYTAWRTQQRLRDREARRMRRIPAWDTASVRFGSWSAACEKAFAG